MRRFGVILLLVSATAAADPQKVSITITKRGFEPEKIVVKKDQELALAFTRKTNATCAKEVIIDLGDGKKITQELPLDKTVEVRAVFRKAGELRYTCAMDMIHGTFSVQ